MRLVILALIFSCTQVLGQRNPFDKVITLDKQDTFEIKYERYVDSKKRVDTLPLFTDDETNGWRNMQLVTYYFDSDSVRMIEFRDGERGYYFFFFYGSDLRKVRISETSKPNVSYYYSPAENHKPQAKVNISFKDGLLRQDRFTLLAAGQALRAKFYNLP